MTVKLETSKKGILFVLSAPSGAGKTTLRKALMKKNLELFYGVSATTRSKRRGEVAGKDYIFLSEKTFCGRIRQGAFWEYANVHGNFYGTLKRPSEVHLKMGHDCLLDIDTQGFMSIKKKHSPVVGIFILPPSRQELAVRLLRRASDNKESIRKRLKNAENEVKYSFLYDYVVVNRDIAKTLDQLVDIIRVERLKRIKEKLIYGYFSA